MFVREGGSRGGNAPSMRHAVVISCIFLDPGHCHANIGRLATEPGARCQGGLARAQSPCIFARAPLVAIVVIVLGQLHPPAPLRRVRATSLRFKRASFTRRS